MCRVNMQGYLMEIDYGMHVRQRLEVRFDGIDCSYLDYRIEVLFGDPEVADYLLNEVRIGEDVVLVDEDSGITFAISLLFLPAMWFRPKGLTGCWKISCWGSTVLTKAK